MSRTESAKKSQTKPKKNVPAIITLPAEGNGHVREPQVLGVFSMSRSKLWRDIRAGIFPAPYKHGGITIWDIRDLRAHMERIRRGSAA